MYESIDNLIIKCKTFNQTFILFELDINKFFLLDGAIYEDLGKAKTQTRIPLL